MFCFISKKLRKIYFHEKFNKNPFLIDKLEHNIIQNLEFNNTLVFINSEVAKVLGHMPLYESKLP